MTAFDYSHTHIKTESKSSSEKVGVGGGISHLYETLISGLVKENQGLGERFIFAIT